MLSSLLRSKKGRRRTDENPIFSTPQNKRAHARADWTEDESGDDMTEDEDAGHNGNGRADDDEEDENEEDNEDDEEETPLLPIFSAAHLGMYPSKSIVPT